MLRLCYAFNLVISMLLFVATSTNTFGLFTHVGGDPTAATSEAKEEMDSRSVFVGNVSLSHPCV